MFTAKYQNTDPNHPAVVERRFTMQGNAEMWLLSHGLGKHDHHFIDGDDVRDKLYKRRYGVAPD